MKLLKDAPALDEYRNDLMRFLTDYGLVAPAILSLVRRSELVEFKSGEAIMSQGEEDAHIFFLVEGRVQISIKAHDRQEVVGERGPVTLLGEISYFNATPATATVEVAGKDPAFVLRLSYDEFTVVIDEFPQIKPTLTRIGDMRVIGQKDGFSSYSFFMEMIGWKRDRLALNRPVVTHLEDAINRVLLPRLSDGDKLLDVGDGPGIVCELIHEQHPELLDQLFIQATHLEDSILNPTLSYPSDFSRTKYLREKFQVICALQIFEHLPPDLIAAQFEEAARLLSTGGHLLVVRLRVAEVVPASGPVDTSLIFDQLLKLVRKSWPGRFDDEELVKISFVDADIDPMMEWNPKFCDMVIDGKLKAPPKDGNIDGALLSILMEQAGNRIFNPEEILFHLLIWHASRKGFILETSDQKEEVGFYFQLYRLGARKAKAG